LEVDQEDFKSELGFVADQKLFIETFVLRKRLPIAKRKRDQES